MFGYKPSTKVWGKFNFLLCDPELHYVNVEQFYNFCNYCDCKL